MAGDEPNQTRSKRWIALVAIPVLYVLSIGPALWLLAHSKPASDSGDPAGRFQFALNLYETIYAPLIWGYERMPWLRQAIDWYHNLFG